MIFTGESTIRTRAGKRRVATRFAVAGALAAAPIAVVTETAQAAPATTHHEQFGLLIPLPEPTDSAPGPEQVPLPWAATYSVTLPG
ncbi:hypothetical protein [Rhodococcus sp. NPDC055024]